MKNNKGFTLIELLAVIVILAIIVLIATPIILGVIENAKKGAAANSALGYIDAVEKVIARKLLENPNYKVPNKITNVDVNIKGDKPASVEILLDKGNIVSAVIDVNGYTSSVENNKVVSTIKRDTNIYKEPGVNYPEFSGTKLVPVTIEDDGTVKKADLNTIWYSYTTKKWANAVVLVSSPSKSYEVNEEILESDISAYLVWIPRYKYAVPAGSSEREISIIFENGTAKTGTNTETGARTNTIDNLVASDYYTHPAFTFDSELKGIWIGKFEITNTTAISLTDFTIKPNIGSVRYNTIKEFYDAILAKKTSYGVI